MDELKKLHKEKFGKDPILIGLYFYDPEQTKKNIRNAIKTGKPYNEYELLTDDEKKYYDKGDLVF